MLTRCRHYIVINIYDGVAQNVTILTFNLHGNLHRCVQLAIVDTRFLLFFESY